MNGKIDMSKDFIVWSKLGMGVCSYFKNLLENQNYHIIEIRSGIVDVCFSKFDNPFFKDLNTLRDEIKKVRDVNCKKIAIIFDDLSCATHFSIKAFNEAITDRSFMGNVLLDGDIVIGIGRINNNNERDTSNKDILYSHIENHNFY